jgi:hypothetical protein
MLTGYSSMVFLAEILSVRRLSVSNVVTNSQTRNEWRVASGGFEGGLSTTMRSFPTEALSRNKANAKTRQNLRKHDRKPNL